MLMNVIAIPVRMEELVTTKSTRTTAPVWQDIQGQTVKVVCSFHSTIWGLPLPFQSSNSRSWLFKVLVLGTTPVKIFWNISHKSQTL